MLLKGRIPTFSNKENFGILFFPGFSAAQFCNRIHSESPAELELNRAIVCSKKIIRGRRGIRRGTTPVLR